ncbi:vWA domain-containing protein [Pseudomonas oryzihabitans]|uniref:Magnesium chelatase subunit ChlD-like protein n=1 Tax=Pseudomonas oryzihabitans TaxID=47885 RepID=A0AAJ2BQP8_9PSED|nr:VWA domain-containing protein [Pseudomonas psychrotolerans]MDR6236695.1 magnesium chelatase subunit ChlD-like protein [Pseudomonas psychrotolerans]MDR6353898.1 magnesium chelatase subunit ChlD-like protein [Pseudomonas psychrotolerans]
MGRTAGGRQGARTLGEEGAIAWLPTLLRGRPRRAADLVRQPRSRRPAQLWLVILDHSASTRRHGALAQAKGLLADWFEQAYRQRVRVAVLQAAGDQPEWSFQGQRSGQALQVWLDTLGAGGGTPLLAGLEEARTWLEGRRRRHPGEECQLLLVTDGRLRELAGLAVPACRTLVLDIELGPVRLGRATELARRLGAEYRHLEEVPEI